jgi:hypothetical protein
MKKYLFLFLLLSSAYGVSAQALLSTKSGVAKFNATGIIRLIVKCFLLMDKL